MDFDAPLTISIIGMIAFLLEFLRRMAIAPSFHVTYDSYALIGLAFFLGLTLMAIHKNKQ